MKVIFRDSFNKDLNKIKQKSPKEKIALAIEEIEKTDLLSKVRNIKKLKGYKFHYRIRISDYRLGIYLEGETVEVVRFLNRKDFYKYFP